MTPKWSTACPDWESRIVAGQSLIPFQPLYPESAEAALRIFRELVVADVAGCPTLGQISLPWLLDFVGAIFGAYDAETGRRLISEALLLISKKNAKSTSAAGIMMTMLLLNWRESAEFSILAPTIEIAKNSFYPARDMVRKDEELSDLLLVQEHYRTITHRVTKAELKVVAADSDTVGGKKSSAVLVDELWLFGKRPNAESMLGEATGGLASRPEGIVIYLSTQSDEPPAGVFAQKLAYARGVRDGTIDDPRFLPVLYEFPKAMIERGEHRDVSNARVTNPNLGASVSPEFLAREMSKAEIAGEHSLRGFMAKHLNVEVGLALGSNRWPGALFWERCAAGITLTQLLERSEVVTIGIDGGGLDDMLALVVLGRARDGKWLHWARCWIHPIVMDRHKGAETRFRDFARDGDLGIVEEIGTDVSELADIVAEVEASGLLDRIGVDQSGISSIVEAIVERGIAADRIIGISQGWRLVGAIKTTERKCAEGGLLHAGSPMMSWCVSNAKVEPRGNAVMITKQNSGSAKIDPLMATFDAVTLMAMNPQPRGCVYDSEPLMVV